MKKLFFLSLFFMCKAQEVVPLPEIDLLTAEIIDITTLTCKTRFSCRLSDRIQVICEQLNRLNADQKRSLKDTLEQRHVNYSWDYAASQCKAISIISAAYTVIAGGYLATAGVSAVLYDLHNLGWFIPVVSGSSACVGYCWKTAHYLYQKMKFCRQLEDILNQEVEQ